MALTTPNEQRGAVAGWAQVGALGGAAAGGARVSGLLSIWPRVAALTLAAACLLCALPMLRVCVPPRAPGVAVAAQARDLE